MTRRTDDKGQFVRQPPADRFWEKVNKAGPTPAHRPELGPCWVWTGPMRGNGYGYTTDYWKKILAHRFSYELEYGPIPEGLNVCHACDNRSCVHPRHLWLGTHRDNTQDALSKGRLSGGGGPPRPGSLNPMARLTEADVRIIRAAYEPGRSHGARITLDVLAERFSVSKSTIHHIVTGKSWTHLD